MTDKKFKISLSTEITITIKTIITVACTLASILWLYHSEVLNPKIQDLKDRVEKVDGNVTWIMENMAGLGNIDKKNVQPANKASVDTATTSGSLNHQ